MEGLHEVRTPVVRHQLKEDRMARNFTIKGIDFTVADYRPRRNEFERGLKYQLLIKVYDTPGKPEWFSYRNTGMRSETIKGCREFAEREIYRWL